MKLFAASNLRVYLCIIQCKQAQGYHDAVSPSLCPCPCPNRHLPELRLSHPIRLRQRARKAHLLLALLLCTLGSLTRDELLHSRHSTSLLLITSIDLNTSDMRILPILVILHDLDLDEESSQSVSVGAAADAFERDVNPAFWLREFERGEVDEVVVAGAAEECDAGWGVGFVGLEVEVDADGNNGGEAGEVDIEVMWLWAIRSDVESLS
jgi:hypothetical protein